MVVRVKRMTGEGVEGLFAVDPFAMDELFGLPMCGRPSPEGAGPCMMPAGHEGSRHGRYVIALVLMSSWIEEDDAIEEDEER